MSAAHEWLKFANDDLRSAEILLRERVFNMACFHAQQLAEKSLKALLRHHGKAIPYIHILEELCEKCIALDASATILMHNCLALDIFYQPTRYPEAPLGSLPEGLPNQQQAEEALKQAKAVFEFVQQKVTATTAR